jgi:hypothetical protein
MTKEQAISATVSKYTNLIDNTVITGVSVRSIIQYYESLRRGEKTDPPKPYSNILDSFIEEDLRAMGDDDEYPHGL